jgi:uncharacterized C2H2 Zn-finger protein
MTADTQSYRGMGPWTTCPKCQSDLLYAENRAYSRLIAIYCRDRDATVAWRCPDCKYTIDRFTGKEITNADRTG